MPARIPLCVPRLDGNEARYLQECVETGYVSSVGPFVSRFEEQVAAEAGTPGAVAVASGTAALHLALLAAGVKPGDLVAVPSFTFIATANAVMHCGAQPWFFDIDEASWCLDAARLERELATETVRRNGHLMHRGTGRRVAALVAVYAMGAPSDLQTLSRLAESFGLPLVADAAGALGSNDWGRRLGGAADLTIFSFNGNKTATAGGGGAVVGLSAERLAHIRHLSTQARTGSGYDHDQVGYNYRMTNLQAAVGCAQMERLAEFVGIKRGIRARYDAAFAGIPGIKPFPSSPCGGSSCWLSGITLENEALPQPQELCRILSYSGVEARAFWKPMHLQVPYAHMPRTDQAVAERLWTKVLTLPCSTSLTQEEQARVIDELRHALNRVGDAVPSIA